MSVVTLPHKVQPSRYALHLLRLWMRRNAWWAIGTPLVVSLILAMFVNTRFVYLSVVLVCLVLPHIFVTVYWRHLLSDRNCRWLLPHTVTIGQQSLTVDYIPEPSDDEPASVEPARPPFTLPISSITGCRLTDDGLLLTLDNDPYHIIIIPTAAFPDTTSLTTTLRQLTPQ